MKGGEFGKYSIISTVLYSTREATFIGVNVLTPSFEKLRATKEEGYIYGGRLHVILPLAKSVSGFCKPAQLLSLHMRAALGVHYSFSAVLKQLIVNYGSPLRRFYLPVAEVATHCLQQTDIT